MQNQFTSEALDTILLSIESGKTLYIQTYGHTWKITKKTLEKFNKINRPLLKHSQNDLWLSSGKKYVCISYAKLTLQ